MNRAAIHALCWAGLAVFTLYLLRVNDAYYQANTQTPTYDEAWYLETSLYLYHRLTDGNFGEFLGAYCKAFGTKAPLISVLPLPFYLLFGTSHYSALLVNSLFIAVSNLYLFLLVRRLFSAEAGLAAVVFYQTMPLAYGLSRTVMTEYGLATLVIVWMYYLIASDGLARGSANFALGVVLGLGLLMKVLFPAFIVGPTLLVWFSRRRSARRAAAGPESVESPPRPAAPSPRRLWRACARWPLAAIILPAAVIAGPWYASNLKTLLAFAWQSAYGNIAPDYGGGGLARWMLAFINEGLGFYYAAALIVFGLAAAWTRARGPQQGSPQPPVTPAAPFLLSWLLPPLIVMAVTPNHLIRFVIPLLPVFAIVLAVSIFQLGSRKLLQAALALLVAIYPQRLYGAMSTYQHGTGHEHPVRWGPFLLFSRDLGWAHPPVWENPWDQRRLLEAIRRLAADTERPQYVIVAVEHVYLNANLLSYLNAYHEYPLRFTSLGYAESSVEKAVERIYSLDARFLVFGEGFQQLPEFLNRVNDQILARIAAGELPFRLRAKVPLAHQMKALIYEREAPWVSFAPGTRAPDPSHPLTADFPGGVRFLGYDWKKRDRFLHEISYYWTVPGRVDQDYRVNVEFRRGDKTVLSQAYDIAGGRHPFPEWSPGEVVRQSLTVYLPPGDSGPLEAWLRLIPWGVGPPLDTVVRLRLAE